MLAGMSPHAFREKAKAFLSLASQTAEFSAREEELNALRKRNEEIQAESNQKIAKMQEQMDSLMAMMAQISYLQYYLKNYIKK